MGGAAAGAPCPASAIRRHDVQKITTDRTLRCERKRCETWPFVPPGRPMVPPPSYSPLSLRTEGDECTASTNRDAFRKCRYCDRGSAREKVKDSRGRKRGSE